MIIVQTPLRISFFGGGTDFPDFYRGEGGCVLTSAIDKFIFLVIKKRFDAKIRIGYTLTEMVDQVDQIQHELIREALRKTGITQGVEITTMGDIPSSGSGLGSSSAVTVGALHAMYTYLGEIVPQSRLAEEACHIEIDTLKKPIGIQDQYIAAYGGLRFLSFQRDGSVEAEQVDLGTDLSRELDARLMLFFTGITRPAESILAEQQVNIVDRMGVLREIKDMAYEARCELIRGNLDCIGWLLNRSWQFKKKLASKITNGLIDEIYSAALQAGAMGGKITGAGGGGFLLLYCPQEKQGEVRKALSNLQELPFKLELDGTKVIFNYRR